MTVIGTVHTFEVSQFPEIYLIFSVIVAINLSNDNDESNFDNKITGSREIAKQVVIYKNILHSILTFRHNGMKGFLKPHSCANTTLHFRI